MFVAGVLAHNLEEALFLPGWSHRRFLRTRIVTAHAFRMAVALYSLVVVLAAAAATHGGAKSAGAYLIVGFAVTMVCNVLFPHLGASLWLRTYAPGTATALLLNLPLGLWFVMNSAATGFIDVGAFRTRGPAIVLAAVVLVPVLLALSQRLTAGSSNAAPASSA